MGKKQAKLTQSHAQRKKTQSLAMTALFAALTLLLGLTPNLGFIRVWALTIVTVHLPVVVGGVILGPKTGALLGFLFGFTSFMGATFLNVGPDAPLFSPFMDNGVFHGNAWSLVVCFVPRILTGVVAGLFCAPSRRIVERAQKRGTAYIPLFFAGFFGTLTNTLLVLGGVYLFFGEQWALSNEITLNALRDTLIAVILSNGLIEVALACVLTVAIGRTLLEIQKRRRMI